MKLMSPKFSAFRGIGYCTRDVDFCQPVFSIFFTIFLFLLLEVQKELPQGPDPGK